MIDYTGNTAADLPVIRTPKIEVLVDVWDWEAGCLAKTLDITKSVLSFTWSKTLSNIMGGCTVSVAPVSLNASGEYEHILDTLSCMDVIRIKEFDKEKFTGYIRRIGTNGTVSGDGKPQRSCVITATHFGGLLQEAQLGYQIIALRIQEIDTKLGGYFGAAQSMAKKIGDKIQSGGVLIKDIVDVVTTEWFKLLDALGATAYRTYLNHYLDMSSGIADFSQQRVLPSELMFFYGTMQDQTLWNELKKLAEAPFNEFFFDNGGRKVWVDEKTCDLPSNKVCLVGRPTPFDGSVRGGTTKNYFTSMDAKKIPLQYLTRYDFNKSSDECHSVYLAVPQYSDFTEVSLFCMGGAEVDSAMVNKYLLRPLTMRLFYATVAQRGATKQVNTVNDFKTEMENATKTMKAWNQYNDQFISGNISMMVPNDSEKDVYIGDKVELEGLTGYFYAEGVTHSWSYGGALSSSLTVTRGFDYDRTKGIRFAERIFTAGRFHGGNS